MDVEEEVRGYACVQAAADVRSHWEQEELPLTMTMVQILHTVVVAVENVVELGPDTRCSWGRLG
jgi:hypothetical protein